jgi:crossover junction endodeoxyribonuclease RuvC
VRIMGIDPSLTGCGLVLLTDGFLKVRKTVSTPASDERGKRLDEISEEVASFILLFKPDVIAIEGYAFGSQFNREEMGEVGGVIKRTIWSSGIEFHIWPNTSWKKVVLGKGNVKKEDVKLPVFQRYNVELSDMNQVEAFCVAMAEHLAQTGMAGRPVVKTKRGRAKKASTPPPKTKGLLREISND